MDDKTFFSTDMYVGILKILDLEVSGQNQTKQRPKLLFDNEKESSVFYFRMFI